MLVCITLSLNYTQKIEVSVAGEEIGLIDDIQEFENNIDNLLLEKIGDNENCIIEDKAKFEYKTVYVKKGEKDEYLNFEKIKEEYKLKYKYYKLYLKDEYVCTVQSKKDIDEFLEDENFTYSEEYIDNLEDINANTKTEAIELVSVKTQELEEKNINLLKNDINGIEIPVTPLRGNISSRYGEISRIRSSAHKGLDISAPQGTQIRACQDGIVEVASYQGAYGNLVVINHGNDVKTYYGHTSKILVSVGQQVSAGDIIALVGSTGNSTGPHLHFEIQVNGTTVNPELVLYNEKAEG